MIMMTNGPWTVACCRSFLFEGDLLFDECCIVLSLRMVLAQLAVIIGSFADICSTGADQYSPSGVCIFIDKSTT